MKLLPVAIFVMVLGPSVAGILLTGLVYGRAGLREFLSRLIRWRVSARWYAVAFLTSPLLITVILFAFSRTSPVFIPGIVTTDDKATLLMSGIVAGLAAGVIEELGWRRGWRSCSFSQPRMLALKIAKASDAASRPWRG